jgi:chromosome segregation ATPase
MEEVLEEVLEEEPTILPQSRARPSPSGGQKTAKGLPISINLGSINYNGEVQNKGAIVGNVVGDGNTIIGYTFILRQLGSLLKSLVGSITTTVNYATSTANNLFKYTLKVREARTRFQAVLDRIQSTSSILSQICNLLEQKVRQIAAGSDIFRDICKEKTFCETLFTRVSRRVQEGTPIRERIEEGSKVTDEDRQKLAQLEQEIFLIGEEIDQCKEKFQLKLWTFTIAIETQK